MLTALLFVALCCSALGAGSAYTTLFAFATGGWTKERWVEQLQQLIPRIGVPLFVVQPIAAVTLIASTVLSREDRLAFPCLAAASVLLIFAAAVTRVVHIPINNRLTAWKSDSLPDDFAALQKKWWRFHVVRSAALLLGFAVLVVGVLTRTS